MPAAILTYQIAGNPASTLLVLLHGWPDDGSLWDGVVEALAGEFRCVQITLPNFGAPSNGKLGVDFSELVERLANTIADIPSSGEGSSAIIIGHDWGAYLAYLLEAKYPEKVRGLITLDVGAHVRPSSVGHSLFLIGYQWTLIAAWASGIFFPAVGDFVTRSLAKVFHAPHPERARAEMNYLYFYFWRDRLFGGNRSVRASPFGIRAPLLFLYGTRKRYMFHTQAWERWVTARTDSNAIGLEAGHWVMRDQPVKTIQLMQSWLADILTTTPAAPAEL